MTATAAPNPRVVAGTVMFTDIVGFTEFTALRGDGEALELLARQERIVRQEMPGDYLPDDLYPFCRYVLDWGNCTEPRWKDTPPHIVTFLG